MAQLNIRIDDNLKAQGEELFTSLGLNFSTAVSVFISQAVREGGLPFAVTTRYDPYFNELNMRILRQSIKEVNEGRLTAHELIED